MSNEECTCKIPNTDLTGRCFKCGEYIKINTANNPNTLPVEVVQKIWFEAERYAEGKVKAINEEHFNVYNAWIAGATAYATKRHEWEQMAERRTIETMKQFQSARDEAYELKKENDKMKEQAAGWRPLLEKVLVMNEMWGDLPGEFINEVKKFLYGE